MEGEHAIIAFTDAHPEFKGVKGSLVAKERDEWQYIYLKKYTAEAEIGRVKIEGNTIIAETFISRG